MFDNLKSFAHEVIDSWDYEFWVVKQITQIQCKCVDPTTKQAKQDC